MTETEFPGFNADSGEVVSPAADSRVIEEAPGDDQTAEADAHEAEVEEKSHYLKSFKVEYASPINQELRDQRREIRDLAKDIEDSNHPMILELAHVLRAWSAAAGITMLLTDQNSSMTSQEIDRERLSMIRSARAVLAVADAVLGVKEDKTMNQAKLVGLVSQFREKIDELLEEVLSSAERQD